MLVGAPPGTSGSAYPSGWMTCENFVGYLKHFIKHSKCSITQQVLLIIDNHESHTSIEALDLCKANGVTLLTIPPHCSHEMQPLDVSVYGPLKKFYNDACTSWMHSNAAIPMTIYNIAQCFGEAYPSAFTPRNILSGFRATGIWPFNRHVFDSDRYIAADVTDRDCQLPASDMVAATGTTDGAVTVSSDAAVDCVESFCSGTNSAATTCENSTTYSVSAIIPAPTSSNDASATQNAAEPEPEPVLVVAEPVNSEEVNCASTGSECMPTTSSVITPEQIRPFPKAGSRKKSRTSVSCERAETRILTDTPVKKQLEIKAAQKRTVKKRIKGKTVPDWQWCKERTDKQEHEEI